MTCGNAPILRAKAVQLAGAPWALQRMRASADADRVATPPGFGQCKCHACESFPGTVSVAEEDRMPEAAVEFEHEIDPRLQEQLLKHAGRWVATTHDRLLAVGDSATEVYRAAREQDVDVPIVFRVLEAGRTYLL